MALAQYRAIWSTAGGGTGYSIFHSVTDDLTPTQAADMAADIRVFFDTIKGLLPDDVLISFDSEVLELQADGTLTDVVAIGTPTAVSGSGATNYARPVGGRVDWVTGEIVGGRRLRGRTYIVPLLASAYDTGGTLTGVAQNALRQAAQDLLNALSADSIPLGVWSRKNSFAASVSSPSVPFSTAVLRSRRD